MSTQLQWQQHRVELRFSKRKTLALHVHEGRIEVRAPARTPTALIKQFLAQKTAWLDKTLAHQQSQARERIDYRYAAHIPFMGFNVALIRQPSQQGNQWSLVQQGLALRLAELEDGEALLDVLEDFYKAQARYWLRRKTEACAERAALAERLTDIRLRRTKTKWGHCTSQGRIQYNWQIMMAPENIIDYLVAHEVSHLRYLDHSPSFWRQVEQLQPSFQADRCWLRANGHRLQLR